MTSFQKHTMIVISITYLLAVRTYSYKDEDGPILQINSGQIRGIQMSSAKNTVFNAFMGIPFAQPPIGDLRFKAPVAVDSWNGVLNTTKDPPQCLQVDAGSIGQVLSFTGNEDCLQLNVYTPDLSPVDAVLPVNVFIYGGGYFVGDVNSTDYGPEKFMDQGVVLILMNYRIGALGFLSTGDAAASGNYGLLDQNLALKWVRDNIASFGGNPNDVTLSGQSAGSASVLYHYLSPMSAGLFNRAIAESGSAICPWALEENPLYMAQALGKHLNCSTDDTAELVDCLRQQDGATLVEKAMVVMIDNLTLSFVPVVENPTTGLFLTEDPTTLLEEGRFNQVPIIMGINRDEGVLIYKYCSFLFKTIDDKFFDEVMPLALTVLTDYRTNLINVSYAIKDEYYIIDVENSTAVARASIDVISDMFMKSWVIETAELISSHDVPVYLYAFNYDADAPATNYTGSNDISHGAELKFLFNMTSKLSDRDIEFGDRFSALWYNFMNTGNPTPSGYSPIWQPTPGGETLYLDINEEFTIVNGYDQQRMDFWLKEVPDIVNA